MDKFKKSQDVVLVNFKLNRNVVEVLDQLVQTGLFKSRIGIVLAALRNYELFKTKWKEMDDLKKKA